MTDKPLALFGTTIGVILGVLLIMALLSPIVYVIGRFGMIFFSRLSDKMDDVEDRIDEWNRK